MTVYARSDVMSVALSRDHGGCGAVHVRPVTRGAPAKAWGLDCHACEDHLRSDPLWAVTLDEVPETPDETKLNEQLAKKGESRRIASQDELIASLASSQEGMQRLLTIMTAALASTNPDVARALAAIGDAGETAATQTAELQLPTPDEVNDRRAELNLEPIGFQDLQPTPAPEEPPLDLAQLTVKDLRGVARLRGVADTGTRAQLIERLSETG